VIFNKEFIHTGKLDARFAKMLYDLFDERLELDYRDFAEVSDEDARNAVLSAEEFVSAIKELTERMRGRKGVVGNIACDHSNG